MRCIAIRLRPGDDLRRSLQENLASSGCQAGFVLQGIGSLSRASVRWAAAAEPIESVSNFEILSLAGSLSLDGAHLHISISDSAGRVTGGHVGFGCNVRTTAEIVLALLPSYRFNRRFDAATGFDELAITELFSDAAAKSRSGSKAEAAGSE